MAFFINFFKIFSFVALFGEFKSKILSTLSKALLIFGFTASNLSSLSYKLPIATDFEAISFNYSVMNYYFIFTAFTADF